MIPRSVKIGGHIFKISAVSKLPGDTVGECDDTANTIKVLRTAARSRKAEIILHECLHALLAGTDFYEEEEILVILSEGLAQMLKDNPHFFATIMTELSSPKKTHKNL